MRQVYANDISSPEEKKVSLSGFYFSTQTSEILSTPNKILNNWMVDICICALMSEKCIIIQFYFHKIISYQKWASFEAIKMLDNKIFDGKVLW